MHSVYQEIECNFQKNDKDFMQKELQKLRDIDDEIFETVEDSTKYIAWLLKESPIPKTAEILWMFIGSSNFIKNSIFDCSETEDIYSVKILFRSIIEHYLRFQFIFTKYGITKSDVESEKYYSILEISEYLNYVKSVRSVASIRGIDSKTLNEMWEELRTQFPYLDKYSKKEIEELSRQFSIKNMILFLEETTKVGKKEDSFLPKMILEYSNLSSYVHGGISAY